MMMDEHLVHTQPLNHTIFPTGRFAGMYNFRNNMASKDTNMQMLNSLCRIFVIFSEGSIFLDKIFTINTTKLPQCDC